MNIKFTLGMCILSFSTLGFAMVRIQPDEELIARFKPVPSEQQHGFSRELKPNLDAHQAPGRKFIGAMDSFGLMRYYLLRDNEAALQLIEGARNGGGWDPKFFYVDEPVVSIEKVGPNGVIIQDIE